MSTTAHAIPPERAALYRKALRHLRRNCERMKDVISRVGPCTWVPGLDDPFDILIRCVISQQISTKAASSIYQKLLTELGGLPIGSAKLARVSDEQFKACGISGPKQRTIRAVVAHFESSPELLEGIRERDEEILREQLTSIKGIGPWTADMFLMFASSRHDILPIGDLGLRVGVQKLFMLEAVPSASEVLELCAKWKPYRSIATWYVWRSLELQAKMKAERERPDQGIRRAAKASQSISGKAITQKRGVSHGKSSRKA